MKQKNVFKLDSTDEQAVDLFVKLGMPKNMAKTLMYLSQVEECCSSEIEQGTDLRQPEVSIAMQELIRKKWVKKHTKKSEGKGRPVHIYQPVLPLNDIWTNFHQEKMDYIGNIEQNFTNLRTLVSD